MLYWLKKSVRRPELNKNNEFLKKHNITILDTNKRFARYKPMKYEYFSDPNDYNFIAQEKLYYDTERLLTIEIPESNLTAIQDFEEQVFNNMKQYGAQHYMMFNVMLEQKEKEKYLRDKFAAVKKAYEHYSLMLKLAESGDIDDA